MSIRRSAPAAFAARACARHSAGSADRQALRQIVEQAEAFHKLHVGLTWSPTTPPAQFEERFAVGRGHPARAEIAAADDIAGQKSEQGTDLSARRSPSSLQSSAATCHSSTASAGRRGALIALTTISYDCRIFSMPRSWAMDSPSAPPPEIATRACYPRHQGRRDPGSMAFPGVSAIPITA